MKGPVTSVVSDARSAGSDDQPHDSNAIPVRSDSRISVSESPSPHPVSGTSYCANNGSVGIGTINGGNVNITVRKISDSFQKI